MTPLGSYDDYADTGLAWLGYVPAHWKLRPLGSCFDERRETVSDKQFPPLSVTMNGIVPQLETAAKTDNGDNRKRVVSGDFVINSRSDRKGSSGLSPLEGSVSLISTVLTPRNSLHPQFVHYVLRSRPFQEEYYRFGTGIVADLWSTRYSSMKRISLAIPPLQEQQWIASFLDAETSRLDELISKQERLIELLTEKRQAVITEAVTKGLDPSASTKPSGTPWQGPVPENWSVQPLKNLVRIQTGVTLGKDYSNAKTESFAYLRVANVQVGRVDLTDVKRINLPADQAVASLLQKGDVLMTEGGDRDKLARGCIWDAPIAPCVHQNHIFAARTKSTLFNEFLVLVLDAAPARTYFFQTGKQSTNLASTNSTTVKNFRFGLPPLDEQHLIVQEVKSKTEKIDTLTAKARAVISVLKERRSALISAAVTGKIDVREGAA